MGQHWVPSGAWTVPRPLLCSCPFLHPLQDVLHHMHAAVHPQLRLVYERPVAARALVGAVSCHVGALMPVEVRALAEAFGAHVALVGFLAGVGPPMVDEVGAMRKGFPALGALERSLAGVCTLVVLQLGSAAEVLGALEALEGSFSGVRPLVLPHLRAAHEALLTVRTFILLSPVQAGGQTLRDLLGSSRKTPVNGIELRSIL